MLQTDDKDAQIEFLKERILKIRDMLDSIFPMYDEYSDEYELHYEVGGISNVKELCDKTLMEVTF
jgi:hypothetical protein